MLKFLVLSGDAEAFQNLGLAYDHPSWRPGFYHMVKEKLVLS
jgi:hypothetical protein